MSNDFEEFAAGITAGFERLAKEVGGAAALDVLPYPQPEPFADMAGPDEAWSGSKGSLPPYSPGYILEQAERCELMASEAPTPQDAEAWQTMANEWRIELPPVEFDPPGPPIDAEYIDIEP